MGWNSCFHDHWTAGQWDSATWSEETKIVLFGNDGIKYERRRIGEDLRSICIKRTVEYKNAVRNCMINANMNGQEYVDEIF